MKTFIRSLVGGAVLAALGAAPGHSATLVEELNGLIQEHPQLRAIRDNVEAAREAITVAGAPGLPNVALAGDVGHKRIDGPGQRAADNIWSRGFEKMTLTVTQTLFDANRNDSARNTAVLSQSLAEIDLRNIRQTLLLEGTAAYINVIRQARLVDLATRNTEIIANRLDLEDERVQRGGGTAVDVLLSKTRLQLAKERSVVFGGALRDAITRYTQVFGHPPDPETMVDPALAAHLVPDDLDAGLVEALQRNPLVVSAGGQVDLARVRQEGARANYFPNVNLVGAYNWEEDREGAIGTRRDASVTVQATWNLFTGFSTRAGAAEAAFGYSSSLNNERFIARRVEEEVRLAWQGINTSCDRRLLLDNAVSIASEVHQARVTLRDAGRETVINVLDAESELFNSEINLLSATYDEKLAVYRLSVAMGRDILVEAQVERDEAARLTAYEARCASNDSPAAAPAGGDLPVNPFRLAPGAAPGGGANFLSPALPGAAADPAAGKAVAALTAFDMDLGISGQPVAGALGFQIDGGISVRGN